MVILSSFFSVCSDLISSPVVMLILVLLSLPDQFEHDTILIPKETSWFGYYPDGSFSPVLPANQVNLFLLHITMLILILTLPDVGKDE